MCRHASGRPPSEDAEGRSGSSCCPLLDERAKSQPVRRSLRRGVEPEGTERVRVSGRDATLVVRSLDYDGTDAIVRGSGVER
jgi:hypothetical protein